MRMYGYSGKEIIGRSGRLPVPDQADEFLDAVAKIEGGKAVEHFETTRVRKNGSVVTISPAGKITDVNEATVKATGLPREGLIGTDFSQYVTDPDRDQEGYRRVFAEGSLTDYPLTLVHRAEVFEVDHPPRSR